MKSKKLISFLFLASALLLPQVLPAAEGKTAVTNTAPKTTATCPEPCEEAGMKAKVQCEEAKKSSSCEQARTNAWKACLAKGCR